MTLKCVLNKDFLQNEKDKNVLINILYITIYFQRGIWLMRNKESERK